MNFKKFLLEGVKESIIIELNELTAAELQEFGEWLYVEFFEEGEYEEGDGAEEPITKEEIIELLGEMSAEDLDYIYDMIADTEESEEDSHTDDNKNIEEGISRRMKAKNRNKKKRKFMGISKADMRRTKVARKKEARKTKVKRHREYMATRVKKLAYSKSRNAAIKKGSHKVKLRRKA